jgi:hypothetical protein
MDVDPKVTLAATEESYRTHKVFCLPCLLPTEAAGVGDRCSTGGPAMQSEIHRLRDIVAKADRDARAELADWGADRARAGIL